MALDGFLESPAIVTFSVRKESQQTIICPYLARICYRITINLWRNVLGY